jgi:hypothetical protein
VQQLGELRECSSSLPWGVVVVATTTSLFDSGRVQSTRWQLCGHDNLTCRIAGLMDARNYKTGVQFGHVFLIVVWDSIRGWWKMLWSGRHTVLWPWRDNCGWHYDDDSNRSKLTPNMVLPLQMHEFKLVHPRHLAKPKSPSPARQKHPIYSEELQVKFLSDSEEISLKYL